MQFVSRTTRAHYGANQHGVKRSTRARSNSKNARATTRAITQTIQWAPPHACANVPSQFVETNLRIILSHPFCLWVSVEWPSFISQEDFVDVGIRSPCFLLVFVLCEWISSMRSPNSYPAYLVVNTIWHRQHCHPQGFCYILDLFRMVFSVVHDVGRVSLESKHMRFSGGEVEFIELNFVVAEGWWLITDWVFKGIISGL